MDDNFEFDHDIEWYGNVGYYKEEDAIFRLHPIIRDGVIKEFTLDVSTIKTQPIHHIDINLNEFLKLEDEDFHHYIGTEAHSFRCGRKCRYLSLSDNI